MVTLLLIILAFTGLLIVWRSQWFQDVFRPSATLTEAQKRRSVHVVGWIALAVVVLLVLKGGQAAATNPDVTSSAFDAVVFLRIALVKTVAAGALWAIAIAVGYFTIQFLDNLFSKVGLVVEDDHLAVAVILAAAVLFGGVLR